MSPEEMAEKLRAVCGENLKSVVLYGSAAAGDHIAKRSDYNILAVLGRLAADDLLSISPLAAQWSKEGNPPPLLFTMNRLRQSADVFPVEFADIKDTRKILFGEDPFGDMAIDSGNLRLELEHELKGKLIRLREKFLLTRGKPGEVEKLLISSLSTFLVLFRSALRLHGHIPPSGKLEALAVLRGELEFDDEVFRLVHEMKKGARAGQAPLELFRRYLTAVEKVTDAIDGWIRQPKKEISSII